MYQLTRRFAYTLVLLCLLFLPAIPALAFGKMVAMDNKSFSDNADKSEIQTRDAVNHEPTTMNFGDKTLGTARPGDRVELNGKAHTLTSITHELQGDKQVSGFGFAIAAILKFKAHGDNK